MALTDLPVGLLRAARFIWALEKEALALKQLCRAGSKRAMKKAEKNEKKFSGPLGIIPSSLFLSFFPSFPFLSFFWSKADNFLTRVWQFHLFSQDQLGLNAQIYKLQPTVVINFTSKSEIQTFLKCCVLR